MFPSLKATSAVIVLALITTFCNGEGTCKVDWYLLNADTNKEVGSLDDYLKDNGYAFCNPNYNVNFEARPNAYCGASESAKMRIDKPGGPIFHYRTEHKVPYTTLGDSNGDIYGEPFVCEGVCTLQAVFWSKPNLQGSLVLDSGTYSFGTKNCGCYIEYILWNADRNVPIRKLNTGDCILAGPGYSYNIQAKPVNCPKTESATILLEGPLGEGLEYYVTENKEPYMIFGDNDKGDVYGKKLLARDYYMWTKLYTKDNAQGCLIRSDDNDPFDITVAKSC